MADNLFVTPGSGASIAADDVSGVLFQRVKLSVGADGVALDMTSAAGAVAASTPRVTLGSDDPAVTSLALLDDLVLAEDAASISGDKGLQVLAVRRAAPVNTSDTDGDYEPLQVSAGRLWTSTALEAGSATIGQVGAPGDVVSVTLTLDIVAYASGDLLAETQSFTGVRVNAGRAVLQSLTVVDEDDQGVAFTVYFLSANNTFGAENAAPSISDAGALDILGFVDVGVGDYKDLGGVKVACLKAIGLCLKASAGSQLIYLAVVNGAGTPTFTASGVKLILGLRQD